MNTTNLKVSTTHAVERIALLLVFLPLVLYLSVFKPVFWVFLYGWVNSPFYHNVKAGWNISVATCFQFDEK